MHTFHHEPTGVRIHYNSDYSGDATVVLPAVSLDGGMHRTQAFEVPAKALVAFGFDAGLDAAKEALEDVTLW